MSSAMPPLEAALRLIAGLLLILANGFFVAIEFALTRARQFKEEEFVTSPALERAWGMTNQLEVYLTSCQVGITASSIALGIVAEPALAAIFARFTQGTVFATISAGAILSFIIINLVHLTHGEQTPTYLGVERSQFVCRYGAAPLYWFTRIIKPIISVGDSAAKFTLGLFGVEMTGAWLETSEETIKSRSELRDRLRDTLEQGNLPDDRMEEVLAAFDVDELVVRDEMVPRDEVAYLSVNNTTEENSDVIQNDPHSRYPLVGDSLDDVRGMIYMSELARHSYNQDTDADLETIAQPAMKLDVETPISVAIDSFQAEGQEIAMVMEDGNVVGIITVTDAIEEVVGELEDPMD